MKELFRRYVAIQYSGLYNMITEAHEAMELAEIKFDDYCYIQEHYSELKEKYPRHFENGKLLGDEIREKLHQN